MNPIGTLDEFIKNLGNKSQIEGNNSSNFENVKISNNSASNEVKVLNYNQDFSHVPIPSGNGSESSKKNKNDPNVSEKNPINNSVVAQKLSKNIIVNNNVGKFYSGTSVKILNKVIKNNPISSDQEPALLDLLKIFCKNTNPEKFCENFENFQKIEKIIHLVSEFSIKCPDCKFLKITMTLDCLHETCLNCFKKNVEDCAESLTIKNFKKATCKKCKISYSEKDIKKIDNSTNQLYEKYFAKTLLKKCLRCRKEKNLRKDFFSEMRCLDLCKNCYSDDLFFNQNSCSCCNKNYKYKETTLKRTQTCDHCSAIGDYVLGVYRNTDENHVLCYSCLENSALEKKCLKCDENIKNNMKNIKNWINKLCSKCHKNIGLGDLNLSKKCCLYNICKNCQSDNPDCQVCFLKMN